jgi:hypothetical protein
MRIDKMTNQEIDAWAQAQHKKTPGITIADLIRRAFTTGAVYSTVVDSMNRAPLPTFTESKENENG